MLLKHLFVCLQEQQHFITISEFFSDGWVLLCVLFISKVTTVLCMRMSQYYLTIQAVHVRAAIQVLYPQHLPLQRLRIPTQKAIFQLGRVQISGYSYGYS